MKKLINSILNQIKIFSNLIKKILIKFKIIFSYTTLCIIFMIIYTFFILHIVGDNILNHERYILKKQFIEKNTQFTLETAGIIAKDIENLDNISIVDLVEKISKQENIAYVYVLNSDGEVIAHSIKSELFKKYPDNYLDKKNLQIFIDNISKVWWVDREYKGKNIIKFSKPILLQFAKNDVIQELKIASTADVTVTNKNNKSVSNTKVLISKNDELNLAKNFYIAGVLYIAVFTNTLELIEHFSKTRTSIFYYIAYLLAIIVGYLIGKFLDNIINLTNHKLTLFLKEEDVNKFNSEDRFDSFKKLFDTINQFIDKYKQHVDKSNISLEEIFDVYKNLIAKLSQNIELGIMITDQYLKLEYFNNFASNFIRNNAKIKIGDNLSIYFEGNTRIIEEINSVMNNKKKFDQPVSIQLKDLIFNISPIIYNEQISKLLIMIKSQKINENDIENNNSNKKNIVEQTEKEESIKTKNEDSVLSVTSRLKRI